MRALASSGIGLAFFLSGASSLIFQAIWTRLLHHVFGATSVAMSSVLTAFMAGLGLGAHYFGKRAARTKRPLRAYALCELGVAVWAAFLPWLLRPEGPVAALNLLLRESLGASSAGFMLARFFCVLPVLLVPTTLMGGTLPFLSQHFVQSGEKRDDASASAGALYAMNTFGAVAGTAAASFWLMPSAGVRFTSNSAVALNLLLGLALLVVDARTRAATPASESPAATRAPSTSNWTRRLAIVAFAVSGACAMTYEVVWSRALSMAIGSSLQSFALILVTFLIGIALGSAVLSRALTSAPHLRTLSLVAAMALTLLALAPALALESWSLALSVWLLVCIVLWSAERLLTRRERIDATLESELDDDATPSAPASGRIYLLVPAAVALFEGTRFLTKRSSLAAAALHGYLPYITGTVVLALCAFFFAVLTFRKQPWLLACAMQLVVALGTLASYAFQDEIPYTFARLVSGVENLPDHVPAVRFFMLFAAGMCTLPATLGMGAMFPLTLSLAGGLRDDVGKDVGTVYAANTLGSILGSWLPGFVLLPRIGMEATLQGAMMLNTLVALGLLLATPKLRPHPSPLPGGEGMRARPLTVGAFALLAALVFFAFSAHSPLRWNLSHMTLGAFRVSLARDVLDENTWGQPDLLYYRDGVSTTVSVERWGAHLSLKNNGKVDASNGDDMPTQIMVAAYPLLMHQKGPHNLDVAIVGFGSGVTVGAALSFPVRHVDAMELESGVVEAASRYFADVNHLPRKSAQFPYVKHPRLTLHNDDGRNYFASTRKTYDVIISEPSNPWITGVSDLFTVDHFRISKQRLKPGGVYCQWVQLYEMSPGNIKTIYRTFASQFRQVFAFAAEELSSDTILIGSDSPLPMDLAHTARIMAEPSVHAELARAFVNTPFDVWSRTLFRSRDELMTFTRREFRNHKEVDRSTGSEPCTAPGCTREPVILNSDDNMRIELGAPSDLIGFERNAGYWRLFYGESWPYGELSTKLAGLGDVRSRVDMALSLLAHGRTRQARVLVDTLRGPLSEDDAIALRTARLMLDLEPAPRHDFSAPVPGPAISPALSSALQRTFDAARKALEASSDRDAALKAIDALSPALREACGPELRLLYGLCLVRAAPGDSTLAREAINELETLIREHVDYARAHPETYYFLARALMLGGSYDKAVRTMLNHAELVSKH